MEDCFDKFEKNSKSFLLYEKNLSNRINDIINVLNENKVDSNKFSRLSFILTQLIGLRDTLKRVGEKKSENSRKFNWSNSLKYFFSNNSNQLTVSFHDCSFDHGYEFWGILPRHSIRP